jgi:hypothetical protein
MPKLRNGHAPGHVREAACDAFEAWLDWDGNGPEPTVEYEINFVPHQIAMSRALGLVWNCSDVIPGDLFARLSTESVPLSSNEPAIKRQTYAACARFVLEEMRARRTAA